METLIHDLRYAVRSLRRSPGFVVVAVLTLAVGVGANTAIFSAIEAVLLRPLPYKEPDRVVYLQEKRPVSGQPNSVSPLNYLDWKTQNSAFDAMAAVRFNFETITAFDTPVPVRGLRVTDQYFDVFGLRPLLGRTFVAGDDGPAVTRVVIPSHETWPSSAAQSRCSASASASARAGSSRGSCSASAPPIPRPAPAPPS